MFKVHASWLVTMLQLKDVVSYLYAIKERIDRSLENISDFVLFIRYICHNYNRIMYDPVEKVTSRRFLFASMSICGMHYKNPVNI